MGSTRTDAWIAYFTLAGDELWRVAVDTTLRERAPLAGLPVLTRLTFPVKGTEDYFFTPEEGDLLDAAVASLRAITAKPGVLGRIRGARAQELVFAGRRARAGECLLYFYGAHPVEKPALAELERQLQGANWKASSADDPGWAFYLNTLHPGPALDPLVLTWAQLEQRRRDGDDLNALREVDHTLLFPDAEGRRRFLAQLDPEVGVRTRLVESDHGKLPCGVTLSLDDRLALPAIEPMVVGLARSAARFGGRYDGWGALEVREAQPA